LEFAIQNLVEGIQAFSATMQASSSGSTITITYVGTGRPTSSTTGANGNRIGIYSYVSGSQTEQWDGSSKQFAGGTSPTEWQITLPFASLTDPVLGLVPANAVRKLRWTYSADLQAGAFVRSEFQVVVSNWTVTGSGQGYSNRRSGKPAHRRRFECAGICRYVDQFGWEFFGRNDSFNQRAWIER
jgi:hypothetical protein